ncbi:MAG: FxsB family cyclophane-forming radical SAM/SPASM peptide maturase [Streptosporangiaceae bacterium]
MTTTGTETPLRQFVIKVCSRCDLACDHCYIYEHADQSWRARPKVISETTVTRAAERIAEYARGHALNEVRIILHGGEPLLAGPDKLGWICAEIRRVLEAVCRLDLRVHTNAVRLGEQFCELFAEHRVKIGISLDGDRDANDLHRKYADGRSSYDQVVAAVNRLRSERYQPLYSGLLCTIDVRNDPVATYDALAALDPPVIDFLLPHATWDQPPPFAAEGKTPYADWLIAVFDRWMADGRRTSVRMFESIIATTNGGRSGTEALGLTPSDLAVIETDGSIEQVDSLKVAYEGAPQTGFDIYQNSLDEVALHPGITARQQGLAGLSATCQRCPVVKSCGGGLYTHRYRTENGFDNPSVYCGDLMELIKHVRSSLDTGQPMHTLPDPDFDAIAAGYGDDRAIGELVQSQHSLVRVLLGNVGQRAGATVPGDAWDVLTDLDADAARAAARNLTEPTDEGRTQPADRIFTHPADRDRTHPVDVVFTHPYVRAWAVRFLPERSTAHNERDIDYLAAIAAAAAIRAGLSVELPVPVRDGFLHLPTLGRLRIPVESTRKLTVSTGSGWFTVHGPDGERTVKLDSSESELPSDWQPVRVLRADGASVTLEDTDPYRDCHQWPAADRLSRDAIAQWQLFYEQAWDLITREFPAYALGLATGLTTITPLANSKPGQEISAAARQAFGAVGAALPDSPATLALLLMHEFQHVKLGAVLDMYQLCNRADTRTYYAPWRDDPRPLEALLQGTYAHIAVTEFWLRSWQRLATSKADAEAAAARFTLWRDQTTIAAETLADSGALTPEGARFVDGLQTTLGQWHDEAVPAGATGMAMQWANQHRSRWEKAIGQR